MQRPEKAAASGEMLWPRFLVKRISASYLIEAKDMTWQLRLSCRSRTMISI